MFNRKYFISKKTWFASVSQNCHSDTKRKGMEGNKWLFSKTLKQKIFRKSSQTKNKNIFIKSQKRKIKIKIHNFLDLYFPDLLL